jgi:predicted ATPase
MLQLARSVEDGSGQTVLVSGEPGIGKSRLVRETERQLAQESWLVLHGACFERDQFVPYAPFLSSNFASCLSG